MWGPGGGLLTDKDLTANVQKVSLWGWFAASCAALVAGPSLFAHSVPVYPYTLTASCAALVAVLCSTPHAPFSAQPDCLLIAYQHTRTHPPHPPP